MEIFAKITEFWKKQEKGGKIRIIAIGVAVIAFAIIALVLVNQVDYAVLYANLDSAEAGNVYNQLTDMNVPVQIRGTGTILVPKDRVSELKATLSADGFPQSGDDLSIFAQASNFGTTDMEKRAYYQFQLQQNLANKIKKFDGITDASVTITMPKESSFVLSSSESKVATASVILTLSSGKRLSAAEADSIRDSVANSVEGLNRSNVSIVDTHMNKYNEDYSGVAGANSVSEQLLLTQDVQSMLQARVLQLLAPVFGTDKVSVAINAKLNFDEAVSESVTFAPPVEGETTGLIVSQKLLGEKVIGDVTQGEDPGFDPNGATVTYPQVDTSNSNEVYIKSSNEYNAEVNEVREQIKKAQGEIESLSVAVIIDGDEQIDAVLPDIEQLVAQGLGITQDYVTVSRMAFVENPASAQYAMAEELAKELESEQATRMYLIIGAAVLLVLTIVILLIITSKANKKKQQKLIEMFESKLATAHEQGLNIAVEDELSIKDILGNKEDDALNQLRVLVDANPESIAQLLRNWLSD